VRGYCKPVMPASRNNAQVLHRSNLCLTETQLRRYPTPVRWRPQPGKAARFLIRFFRLVYSNIRFVLIVRARKMNWFGCLPQTTIRRDAGVFPFGSLFSLGGSNEHVAKLPDTSIATRRHEKLVSPASLIDNIEVVPEPSTILLCVFGAIASLFAQCHRHVSRWIMK